MSSQPNTGILKNERSEYHIFHTLFNGSHCVENETRLIMGHTRHFDLILARVLFHVEIGEKQRQFVLDE